MPIPLPPGCNGFQPQLNLVYSTGNRNGPFRLGWNLRMPSVTMIVYVMPLAVTCATLGGTLGPARRARNHHSLSRDET